MSNKDKSSFIFLSQFIQAIRDSGYRGFSAAIAELVDNAFDAEATDVEIEIRWEINNNGEEITVYVLDNGHGMNVETLWRSLQFGWSSKFNNRDSKGRYGMGLGNASLSQARRVEVYSWTKPHDVLWTYLDVDEVVSGKICSIPRPRRKKLDLDPEKTSSEHGTLIIWSRCDRIKCRRSKPLIAKLHRDLGRIFRQLLWEGKSININGDKVNPIDPLFLRKGNNLMGAKQYGSTITYDVEVPEAISSKLLSTVAVRFTELPMDKWHDLSNKEKQFHGISKAAGVSILRAGREIDYGWFLMGKKRKENYDDWWRCEIKFEPVLDELFGVTNTKQGIHPGELITGILSPDMERIAHVLNSRVRTGFMELKRDSAILSSEKRAEERDLYLEPPISTIDNSQNFKEIKPSHNKYLSRKMKLSGLKYKIIHKPLEQLSFYTSMLSNGELFVVLNEEHPFFEKFYYPIVNSDNPEMKKYRENIELVILALARAEYELLAKFDKEVFDKLRESFSNNLAVFMT